MKKAPKIPKTRPTYVCETQPLPRSWQVIIFLVIVGVFVGCWLIVSKANEAQTQDFAIKQACVEQGFPEVIEINSTVFCHRLNNGTDEIIPLDWTDFGDE